MGEGCPGAGCGTEGPGTAAAGGCAAVAGGAGEGRPLGAGTGSFCGVLGPLSSGPGPAGQEQHGQLGQAGALQPPPGLPAAPATGTTDHLQTREEEGRKGDEEGGRAGRGKEEKVSKQNQASLPIGQWHSRMDTGEMAQK